MLMMTICRREIVWTVCGTRAYPHPSIMDIRLDLSADGNDDYVQKGDSVDCVRDPGVPPPQHHGHKAGPQC